MPLFNQPPPVTTVAAERSVVAPQPPHIFGDKYINPTQGPVTHNNIIRLAEFSREAIIMKLK
jgi:hypothetical protein